MGVMYGPMNSKCVVIGFNSLPDNTDLALLFTGFSAVRRTDADLFEGEDLIEDEGEGEGTAGECFLETDAFRRDGDRVVAD